MPVHRMYYVSVPILIWGDIAVNKRALQTFYSTGTFCGERAQNKITFIGDNLMEKNLSYC